MKYRNHLVVSLLTLALSCAACGVSNEIVDEAGVPDASESPQLSGKPWHDVTHNASYTGQIHLMFKEDAAVRLEGSGLKSLKGINVTPLQDIFKKYASAGSDLQRGITSRTEEEIDAMRERAAAKNIEISDWNSYFRIKVEDPDKAEELLNILNGLEEIKWAEPVMKTYSTSIFSPSDPLIDQQSYLEGTNSLNIRAAWNAGLTGNKVTVTDMEYGWNFNHEDLPIDVDDKIYSGADNQLPLDDLHVQHGTASVGIVAAIPNNDKGTSGIAPGVQMKVLPADEYYAGQLAVLVGQLFYPNPPMKRGDILFIEMQIAGPLGCDPVTQVGCLPLEADSGAREGIKNLISAGIIVIEGAGNGSIDLDTSEANKEGVAAPPPLITDATKAILDGASQGANRTKTWYSNCHDTRLDVFAWGEGIVSAGYGNYEEVSTSGDLNRAYTNIFGGTSSATAITAGVVALLQEHAKNLYEDNWPYKHVYLNIDQIRSLLSQSGTSAIYDPSSSGSNWNCGIGKQPDIAIAMQLLDSGTIKPTIELNPQFNLRYDLDGDKRSDLIEYSSDGKWYIDLSSEGSSVDNFGSWDRIITAPTVGSGKIFPVVADYNNDGLADLALYNSTTGIWYIKYTDSELMDGNFGEWDKDIHYSLYYEVATDKGWKPNSRPVPGFYDDDGWLDIAMTTPSGYWLIDFGGLSYDESNNFQVPIDEFGNIDESVKFLEQEQLDAAPGWSYLTAVNFDDDSNAELTYKSPDGIGADGEKLFRRFQYDNYVDDNASSQPIYGGFETQLVYYANTAASSLDTAIGLRDTAGNWSYAPTQITSMILSPFPATGYGGVNCRPVPGDYDGDNKEERAVMCGNHWRIAYSGMAYPVGSSGFRDVYLPSGPILPLPPVVYGGGISYQEIIDTFAAYNFGCPSDQVCTSIHDMEPPIGPFFAECVKMWAPPPTYCLGK